jgi:hypothetical protein
MKRLSKGLKEIVSLSPSQEGHVSVVEALVPAHGTSEGRDSTDTEADHPDLTLVWNQHSHHKFNQTMVAGQTVYEGTGHTGQQSESRQTLPGPTAVATTSYF